MKPRWEVAEPPGAPAAELAAALACSPLLASALLGRGITDAARAEAFLEPRLQRLGDPFDLPDMDRAVRRLLAARARGESVLLFGDYDVDGVSATAILQEALTMLGWQVSHYLPGRFTEGYGLSAESVRNCLAGHPATLLVAVDCGSSSAVVIGGLAAAGIEVVVLDHHQVGDPVPDAVALVNPQRLADSQGHPAGSLCSAGLAFKLVHAVVKEGRRNGLAAESALDLRVWLDLVALGTVADLVRLEGENRILVSAGLRRMARRERAGLAALMEVAGVQGDPGVYEVGFQLAPRLNAAGRLQTAQAALELLLTRDDTVAVELAAELDGRNRERQAIERNVAEQALKRVERAFDASRDRVIVEADASWHIGVVGIVASRVVRTFHRPALILGGDGEHLRGSGRSIEGFDLAAALKECGDVLERHGGHAMAAGISLQPALLPAFRDRMNQIAGRVLEARHLQPVLRLDGERALAELSLEAVEELAGLEPIGQGNPPVQLAIRGLRSEGVPRRMGQDRQHVRFVVRQGAARAEVVWWGAAAAPMPTGIFDLAARPEINDFRGRRTVQLRLLDWRPAAG